MSACCEVCKTKLQILQNQIYKTPGNPVIISLCPSHDHELFLIGQYRFVRKYHAQLDANYHIKERVEKKTAA